jgi:hypothetical protein
MNYQNFINCLRAFPSHQWINQYFDLQKRLLTELQIENDDPRLALTFTQKKLPVNLGQRYVIRPEFDNFIRCIVPLSFEEKAVGAEYLLGFTRNKIIEAKWIKLPFHGKGFPQIVYNACIEACMDILRRSKKSSFRKFHQPFLYDFTMEQSVRNEILREV